MPIFKITVERTTVEKRDFFEEAANRAEAMDLAIAAATSDAPEGMYTWTPVFGTAAVTRAVEVKEGYDPNV
jgi:hypothetical protein